MEHKDVVKAIYILNEGIEGFTMTSNISCVILAWYYLVKARRLKTLHLHLHLYLQFVHK